MDKLAEAQAEARADSSSTSAAAQLAKESDYSTSVAGADKSDKSSPIYATVEETKF